MQFSLAQIQAAKLVSLDLKIGQIAEAIAIPPDELAGWLDLEGFDALVAVFDDEQRKSLELKHLQAQIDRLKAETQKTYFDLAQRGASVQLQPDGTWSIEPPSEIPNPTIPFPATVIP